MYRSYLLATAAAVAVSAIPLSSARADTATASQGIETVVVTASPIAGDIDRFATIVAKVDRDDIIRQGGGTLADALSNVPGVASSGFAAGVGRPIIRGMDAVRVRVLEDGTSSSDVSDVGPDHGVPIDPLSVQSIEVVRGAATLRYGSQAIGGVVNALNNRVPTALPDKPFSAEADAAYDSVSDAGQTAVMADAREGDFAFHADGFYRHADDYDTPIGTQANSFQRGDGYTAGASYFPDDDTHFGIAAIHYDSKYGIPSDTTFIDMRQTKVLARGSIGLGGPLFQTLNVDASYATYTHNEDDPLGGGAFDVVSTFKNREYDGRAELVMGPIGPLASTAVGIELQSREYSALGDDSAFLFPTVTHTAAAFVFTELPVGDALHIQGSARIENSDINGTPASNVFTQRSFVPISGAIGVLYDVSDAVKVGVTASSTARSPAITELFARGAHDGPATFETGNPALHMERANSVETTLRLRLDRFRFDASAYYTSFDNYIFGQLTGRTCDDDGVCVAGPGEELKELNYEQAGAHFYGAEAQGSYEVWRTGTGGLTADVLADSVHAKLTGGLNVPRIPPWRVGGGFSWKSDMIDASLRAFYIGEQTDFGSFDTPTASYISLDANLAWRPFVSHPGYEIALVGHNLTDDLQRNAASFNKDVVALPGRDIRVVLRIAT
ncbi:MAG: TonB-dependent receptor [Rhizomicrobium sp.]